MWYSRLRIQLVTAASWVTAVVQFLTQELPHAICVAKKEKKKTDFIILHSQETLPLMLFSPLLSLLLDHQSSLVLLSVGTGSVSQ